MISSSVGQPESTRYDLLALGEALVDLISVEFLPSLVDATGFHRFVGGQVTNLAMTMARLGKRAALGACVGRDGLGTLIRRTLRQAGVETKYMQVIDRAPTTVVINTRQTQTPDFVIHRGADAYLEFNSDLKEALRDSRSVHTSAFALARDPARSTILALLAQAYQSGKVVSLDPNYHPRTWPDVPDMHAVLRSAYEYVSVTKPSLDDCERLFGEGLSPFEYTGRFLDWGAEIVALSMGAEGIILATQAGARYHLHPNQVTVVDVTGAGDACWTGILAALFDGASPLEACRFGQALAELKVGTLGPITDLPAPERLAEMAQAVQYTMIP